MAKVPDYIQVSPLTLVCPRCKMKPGKACAKPFDDDIEVVHIPRIAAAAAMDAKAKKARKK
jgi:hypothetical protein